MSLLEVPPPVPATIKQKKYIEHLYRNLTTKEIRAWFFKTVVPDKEYDDTLQGLNKLDASVIINKLQRAGSITQKQAKDYKPSWRDLMAYINDDYEEEWGDR